MAQILVSGSTLSVVLFSLTCFAVFFSLGCWYLGLALMVNRRVLPLLLHVLLTSRWLWI